MAVSIRCIIIFVSVALHEVHCQALLNGTLPKEGVLSQIMEILKPIFGILTLPTNSGNIALTLECSVAKSDFHLRSTDYYLKYTNSPYKIGLARCAWMNVKAPTEVTDAFIKTYYFTHSWWLPDNREYYAPALEFDVGSQRTYRILAEEEGKYSIMEFCLEGTIDTSLNIYTFKKQDPNNQTLNKIRGIVKGYGIDLNDMRRFTHECFSFKNDGII